MTSGHLCWLVAALTEPVDITSWSNPSVAIQVCVGVVLLFTLLFVARQAQGAVGAARGQAWLNAQRVINKSKKRNLRLRIMGIERVVDAQEWDGGEVRPVREGAPVSRQEALDACRMMDLIAWAGVWRFLPPRIALSIWGDLFRKTWIVLKPLVDKERSDRSWPFLWASFERYGDGAIARFGYPERWVPKDVTTKWKQKTSRQLDWPWDMVKPGRGQCRVWGAMLRWEWKWAVSRLGSLLALRLRSASSALEGAENVPPAGHTQ